MTLVATRSRPRPGPRRTLASDWQLDPDRCAGHVGLPRTPWSARLCVLGGRLRVVSGADQTVHLNAVLSPRALATTVPFTRPLFLPDVAPTARLMLVAQGRPSTLQAELWAGEREWLAELRFAMRTVEDDLAVVELAGELRCRPYTWLNGTRLRIEAVAEVRRCG
jgi:hypothetical protein